MVCLQALVIFFTHPAVRGDDDYTVIAPISQQWPVVTLRHELPYAYFGTSARWSFPALVTEIRPDGMDAANAKAKNYDVRIYADDDNNAGN